jgi:thiamine-phosphate pyrophosphorylase
MNFPRLQYITDSVKNVEIACASGIKWIQGRIKNKPIEDTKNILKEMSDICKSHNCIFIVNDFPEIALEIEASGVHLGKNDSKISEAKNIFGNKNFIVGGTANTCEDIGELINNNVDYIGLGPLRFTSTKEKLSPILGIEGYQQILRLNQNTTTPIFAIGGIIPEDVNSLLSVGVYGVAVSGYLSLAKDKKKAVQDFEEKLNQINYAR